MQLRCAIHIIKKVTAEGRSAAFKMETHFVLAADSERARETGDIALNSKTVIGRAPDWTDAHKHVLPQDWLQISSTHCRVFSVSSGSVRALCALLPSPQTSCLYGKVCLPVRRRSSLWTKARTVRKLWCMLSVPAMVPSAVATVLHAVACACRHSR